MASKLTDATSAQAGGPGDLRVGQALRMELLDNVTPELGQPLYLLLQLGKASRHSTKLRIRVFDGCDALELPRLGPVLLRRVAIIGDHYDPRLRWKR